MGGSIAVQLQVNGYSRFGLNIDLLFHQSKENKWQIFDIVLNRDSLINYYQRMVSIKTRRYGVYGMLGRI
jgi:phospholipid transport system substrate-binding protein